MADANCEVTYAAEENCCAVDLGSAVVEPEPPLPEPPPPTVNDLAFAFQFVFGSGLDPIAAGSKIALPSPYAGTITRWRARVANGSKGGSLDWAEIAIAVGEIMEVEYVSGDSLGVTLCVECESEL